MVGYRRKEPVMFKAMVLVCTLAQPTTCVVFEDNIKLRETEEECRIRATEMVEQLQATLPFPNHMAFKCEKQHGV